MEVGRRGLFTGIYCGGLDPEYAMLASVIHRDPDNSGLLFRDHVWVSRGCFEGVPLNAMVRFSARVVEYETRSKGIYVSETHGIRCRIVGKKHKQRGLRGISDMEVVYVP